MLETLFTLVALGLGVAVFLLLRTVGDMAEARGHSPCPLWILFLFGPRLGR